MTRLRYSKAGKKLFSQTVMCGTEFMYVVIDPEILQFTVMKCGFGLGGAEEPVLYGSASSLTKLKREAKQAMKDLDARFLDEIRNAGKTEKFEP